MRKRMEPNLRRELENISNSYLEKHGCEKWFELIRIAEEAKTVERLPLAILEELIRIGFDEVKANT